MIAAGTGSDETLPPFACVPGLTPRHAPGTFDALHASVRPGMTRSALAKTAAFRAGLRYHYAGYHWEAHEAWEPVWQALPPNSAERQFVQALIQLANAELKLRMKRPGAALRLCAIAARHLAEARRCGARSILGQDPAPVAARIADCRARAEGFAKDVI